MITDTTPMQKPYQQISVYGPDRVVLDAICKREGRTITGQFKVILDQFCKTERLNRTTGEKLNGRNRKTA